MIVQPTYKYPIDKGKRKIGKINFSNPYIYEKNQRLIAVAAAENGNALFATTSQLYNKSKMVIFFDGEPRKL